MLRSGLSSQSPKSGCAVLSKEEDDEEELLLAADVVWSSF